MTWLVRLVRWLVRKNVYVPEPVFGWALRHAVERKGLLW